MLFSLQNKCVKDINTGQLEACAIPIWKKKKIEQRTLLYNHIPVKLVSGNWFTPCPMLLLEFERTAKANLSS